MYHRTKPTSNDEYLERMSHAIFTAGLNWQTIEKKWPGIKQAFADFSIDKVASFQEPEIEELMMNPAVIRNLAKIRAIVANAKEMQKVIDEYGSVEGYLKSVRASGGEQALRAGIHKRFAFMGDSTAVFFLFSVGEELPEVSKEWEAQHLEHTHKEEEGGVKA